MARRRHCYRVNSALVLVGGSWVVASWSRERPLDVVERVEQRLQRRCGLYWDLHVGVERHLGRLAGERVGLILRVGGRKGDSPHIVAVTNRDNGDQAVGQDLTGRLAGDLGAVVVEQADVASGGEDAPCEVGVDLGRRVVLGSTAM